jgi:LytS/YehU family sensor histidine kinase
VYRYVLLKKDDTLVPVQEEITFIETYIALHRERLGEALNFTAEDIPTHYFIPPLSLQLLIENAIKHNIASSQSPLHLKIYSSGDYLCVENNLQLKQSSYSTQTGLSNLVKRYRFLTDKQVKVIEDDDRFVVKIPLLQKESLFRP